MKIENGPKHLIRLAKSNADETGWAKVSKQVWPMLDSVPAELLEREGSREEGGRCRLTADGEIVLKWM